MKYSGIDLHSNNSVVVVSDEADRVLVRRRVPNDAEAILALLAAHRDDLHVAGYDVAYQEYSGGHDFFWWRETLADGLIALLRPEAR